jgi:hypothetical protein
MTRTLLAFFVLLFACSDPAPSPDGGSPGDSGTTDAGSVLDGASPDTGRADAGGTTTCETDAASAPIGAEGGSVSLCGATITVLPGTVTTAAEFRIEELGAPVGAAPFELALASSVFRFSTTATRLSNYLRITIPHTAAGRTIVPFGIAEDGSLVGIEPCHLDDRVAVIDTIALGPYVVYYETYDYPEDVSGLGSGTISATFIDEGFELDLDTSPNYAIRTESPDLHEITLHATVDSTPYRRLVVRLHTDSAGGSPEFVHASYSTVSGAEVTLWESGDEAALELTSTGAHSHRGSLRVPMSTSGVTGPIELALELEFTTEKWRWPPELACAIGHEG